MILHQWVPSAHRGDAVGDHARRVRDRLRALGHTSELFALEIDDDLRGDVRPWQAPEAREGDVTLLHFAGPSPLTEVLTRLPGTRVIQYHNITPASYVAPFDPALAGMAAAGRRELASLAGRVDLALADSEYNRGELAALGFVETAVLPIAVDPGRLTSAPGVPSLERLLRDGMANILFVGRIVPNKRLEDHIRLAEHYKRYVDSFYRFIFIGRQDAVPAYYQAIRALVLEYRMPPDRFWFVGPVPERELAAYYRQAHAYVSLSDHEGFGVPLIEAMAMDVPVLAYAAGAVAETLGGAGLAFAPRDLELAAELLGALVYDQDLRDRVLAGQRRRVRDFAPERFDARLQDVLARVA